MTKIVTITAEDEDGQFAKKFSQNRTEYVPDSIRYIGSFHHTSRNNNSVNDKASKNGYNNSSRMLTLNYSILILVLVTNSIEIKPVSEKES